MGFVTYIKESYNELVNHVTWPSWTEAQKLTVTVAVFSIIFALIVYGIDTVFSKALTSYFNLIKNS